MLISMLGLLININIVYQLWKWEKDMFTTKDDKHEHTFCSYRVTESASKSIQIKKN